MLSRQSCHCNSTDGAKHAAVAGDTLFALGCGRMFEGNAQQMWTSLSKLKPLPPSTKVFCAHEYTQSNAKFALSVDPDNQALQKRAALINDLRKQARHTSRPSPSRLASYLVQFRLLQIACHTYDALRMLSRASDGISFALMPVVGINMSRHVRCTALVSITGRPALPCAGHPYHSQYLARGAGYKPVPTTKRPSHS